MGVYGSITSTNPFCCTKGSLYWNKVLQGTIGEKEMFEEPLTEWFSWEPKKVLFSSGKKPGPTRGPQETFKGKYLKLVQTGP